MWWSSWLSFAKEKSISALSVTKRDLGEFVSVLGSDTKAVVEGASANLNKIIKQQSDDDGDEGVSDGKKKSLTDMVEPHAPYNRCQAELFTLQSSSDTYLQDPSEQGKLNWNNFKKFSLKYSFMHKLTIWGMN